MNERDEELLAWCPEFELGVEEVDLQHRYFLKQINRLHRALQRSEEHAKQVALLRELNAYVKFHFISEENMMRFSGYKQIAEHQRHHYELIDRLNARESGLNLRYNEEEARAVITFLVDWFRDHTMGEDKRFADYLHRQGAGAR